jgi:hypothetical protein
VSIAASGVSGISTPFKLPRGRRSASSGRLARVMRAQKLFSEILVTPTIM